MAYSFHKYNRRLEKHFIYGHFRKDTCKLFYIGLGTIQKGSYQRAFAQNGRNPHWCNIVNKTDYKIVILFTTNDLEEAKNKEIYYISKYKDKLCNISSGGDQPHENFIKRKEVFQYSLDGNYVRKWSSVQVIEQELSYPSSTLCRC